MKNFNEQIPHLVLQYFLRVVKETPQLTIHAKKVLEELHKSTYHGSNPFGGWTDMKDLEKRMKDYTLNHSSSIGITVNTEENYITAMLNHLIHFVIGTNGLLPPKMLGEFGGKVYQMVQMALHGEEVTPLISKQETVPTFSEEEVKSIIAKYEQLRQKSDGKEIIPFPEFMAQHVAHKAAAQKNAVSKTNKSKVKPNVKKANPKNDSAPTVVELGNPFVNAMPISNPFLNWQ